MARRHLGDLFPRRAAVGRAPKAVGLRAPKPSRWAIQEEDDLTFAAVPTGLAVVNHPGRSAVFALHDAGAGVWSEASFVEREQDVQVIIWIDRDHVGEVVHERFTELRLRLARPNVGPMDATVGRF